MRVISGKYKGTRIASPHGNVRPTTDLVKGSLFSILSSRGLIDGAECLDIFCGSGSLGIEALSRGAKSCIFADADTSNVTVNLEKLKIDCRLIRADFRRALRIVKDSKFDIIFCDPPYKSGYADEVLLSVFKYGLLKDGGVVIIEHSSANDLINLPKNCIIDRRDFGASSFEIISRGDNESGVCGDV